jgi:colicin import membrane protein
VRPAEYTAEEIIAAGEAIRATGRNVTGFALRQRVGGGNPSRLRQVWDEHLAGKNAVAAEPVAELPVEVAEAVAAVSQALAERIAAFAVKLNDTAVRAAERRVTEVVRTAGEQCAQAERELADAAQTVDDLEASLEQVKGERQALKSQLAEKQAESQRQAVELAQLCERMTVSENSLREYRKDVEKEMQRGAERLIAAEKACDEFAEEARAARESMARLAGQVEALQAQNAQLLESLGAKAGVGRA